MGQSFHRYISSARVLAPRTLTPQFLFGHTRPPAISIKRLFTTDYAPTCLESEYSYIEDVECMERYEPGGYHPIQIGDRLHDRYRILYKLGHGAYSTTWLARDQQSSKLVAVKVGTADISPEEADIVSSLHTAVQATDLSRNTASNLFAPVVEKFEIQGPNGRHHCYTKFPGRASLSDVKDASYTRLFQPDVARALVAQLALAVAIFHAQDYVHGDLHLGNVLLTLPSSFHDTTDEQLFENYGAPETEPVIRLDGDSIPLGVPSHGVFPLWLGEPSEQVTLPRAQIWLMDFGEAFSPSLETRYDTFAPISVRPPELLFHSRGNPVSFSSDVWSLGCAFWKILGQRALFEASYEDRDAIICEQVDALGSSVPSQWWSGWEARSDYFTQHGKPLANRQVRTLEDRFDDSICFPREQGGMPQVSSEERAAILDMLRPMLAFRPEDRCTAAQVLESKWMTEWAFPTYQKMHGLGGSGRT